MRDIAGNLYCNDGDWVESHTTLVENFDGTLELVHWKLAHVTQGMALKEAAAGIAVA